MGIVRRQEKASEIRDLATSINALSSELEEEGYKVELKFTAKKNKIIDVKVTKLIKL